MGLDLTAYSRVELLEVLPEYQAYEDKYGWDDDTLRYIYPNPDFPERMTPVVAGGVYKIHGGKFAFRGGSYSGYNEWRNDLCKLMLGVPAETIWQNRETFSKVSFYELIDFSDCEGVIGSEAAKRLADAFDAGQSRADEFMHEKRRDYFEWFQRKYGEWRKAFHLAADNGYVYFH